MNFELQCLQGACSAIKLRKYLLYTLYVDTTLRINIWLIMDYSLTYFTFINYVIIMITLFTEGKKNNV